MVATAMREGHISCGLFLLLFVYSYIGIFQCTSITHEVLVTNNRI